MSHPIATVAIMLAPGGSNGVSKYLMNFAGKPLLVWSILQASVSETVDRVCVISDSEDVLEMATRYGAYPIKWDGELAIAAVSSSIALQYAVGIIASKFEAEPDRIIFLQPTSPLREPSDIDRAVGVFISQKADFLSSGTEFGDVFSWIESDGLLSKRAIGLPNFGSDEGGKSAFMENGSIYIFRAPLLREKGNPFSGRRAGRYPMPFWKSFEADTVDNIELCEFLFRKHLLNNWGGQENGLATFKPDLMVYDFDGVMTDNRVLVMQNGTEGVFANRADGWGVGRLRQAGWRQMILSTETNPVVSLRARKLNLEVLQGSGDKRRDLVAYCEANGISLDRVLYVGNDVNDLDAMRIVGFAVAPSDAHPKVLSIAKYVTRAKGGDGVIKEISEVLLADL